MDDAVTADELLGVWRDAIRGAELAERLAEAAAAAARQADARALASAEIAQLADQAAAAANRAAERARSAAAEAAAHAAALGDEAPPARAIAVTAREQQDAAEAAYQRARTTTDGPAPIEARERR